MNGDREEEEYRVFGGRIRELETKLEVSNTQTMTYWHMSSIAIRERDAARAMVKELMTWVEDELGFASDQGWSEDLAYKEGLAILAKAKALYG